MSHRLARLRPLAAPLRRPQRAQFPCGVRAVSTPAPQPLRLPPDMPREDYASPAVYAFSTLGRIVKYLVLGAVGIGGTVYATYEGVHAYVENVSLAAPSRAAPDDKYAWADENLPFTGGVKGGTDPRLGWKGRHALRAAYIAWEWGAGEASALAIQRRSFHPDIGGVAARESWVDRGYEIAEEYIDVATAAARKNGIVFPRDIAGLGPPTSSGGGAVPDPTATALLSLKAGVLERMNTPATLAHAKEIYERVLWAENGAPDASPAHTARVVRLAHKIGDLALRAGENADEWWAWGLKRAGLTLPEPAPASPKRSWWSFGSTPATPAEPLPVLPPTVLRAAAGILIASSAASAQSGALARASEAQNTATALLPPPHWVNGRLGVSVPTSSTGPETLQATWEASRAALLELHCASVAHARSEKPSVAIALSSDAADHADAVLSALTPTLPVAYTARGSPLAQPAERLQRDTLLTGAEAYFTHGALLERAASTAKVDDRVHELEHASEAYERAMSLSAAESGTTDAHHLGDADAVGRGEDWARYWRGYVRSREKIMKIMTEEGKK